MTDKSEKAGSELAANATFNGRATAQQGETRAKQGGKERYFGWLLVNYQFFLSEKRLCLFGFVVCFLDQNRSYFMSCIRKLSKHTIVKHLSVPLVSTEL